MNSLGLPVIVGAFVATWILLALLWWKQAKELRILKAALKGSGGEQLEPLLLDHLRSKGRLENNYKEACDRISALESWAKDANARTGFVRYDAFDDIGGRQSFALALQNEYGDGIVLTTIVGRDQMRLYGKAITNGQCEQGLTPEEQEALRLATRGRQ